MADSRVHQDIQVRNSDLYADLLALGVSLETAPVSAEDDFNGIRSWLRAANDPALPWYTAPVITFRAADNRLIALEAGFEELVKVSVADTTPGFLDDKIVGGTLISTNILNPAGDEDLEINFGGTLAELNAAITDATLIDDSVTLTAGAGLTGGGDLSANRTFDVVNLDGSITVLADAILVGILQTDAQHGARGGGTQHDDATGAVAGFMSPADKTTFDTHLNPIDTSNPHVVTLDQAYVAGSALLTLTGLGTLVVRDTTASNATTSVALQLSRTGGSLGVGDGVGLNFSLNSDTGTTRDAFMISSEWGDATDGAEFSEVVFSGRVAGIFTEALRFRNAGLATAIVTPLALNLSPNGDVDDGLQITTIASDVFIVPFNASNAFFLGNTVADPSVDLDRATARAISLIPLGTTLTSGGAGEWVNFGSTITLDYVNGTIGGLISATGVFQFNQAGNGFGAGNLFKNAATFKNQTAVAVSFGSQYTFVNTATYQADAASISSLFWRNCLFQTTWNVIAGGTLAITTVNAGGFINPNIGASVTFTNMRDWEWGAGVFNGTVTNRAHLYFAATNTPAVTVFSGIQSLLAASANHRFIRHTGTAQSDFGGTVGFGAGATVDVLLSRGAANRLDLATGDSFRLVSGSLQFSGTAEQISRTAGELLLTAAIVRTTQDLEIDGDLNHDGTNVGFHGIAPAPLSAVYAPTNVTPDRAYDANATSINEIADVLGTLIADLQLKGLIGV